MTIFTIGFLNMFIAIITAHYNEYKRYQGNSEALGFFNVILSILRTHMFRSDSKRSQCLQRMANKFACFKQMEEHRDQLQSSIREKKEQKYKELQSRKNLQRSADSQNLEQAAPTVMADRIPHPQQLKIEEYPETMRVYVKQLQDLERKVKLGQLSEDEARVIEKQMINNVATYKRYENFGWEPGPTDLVSTNFWLYNLEEEVKSLSSGNISFFDLQGEDKFYSMLFENMDPDDLNNL